MAAIRRLIKEFGEIRKYGIKNFPNIQGLLFLTILHMIRGASELKSTFQPNTHSNHRRSHLKQRSTTQSSMKKGRSQPRPPKCSPCMLTKSVYSMINYSS
uniref:Uncharacterized protein n=1 Tax=Spermophilus dauricus TaxID=99837 RepID=A0A8C9UUA2_SPEDA